MRGDTSVRGPETPCQLPSEGLCPTDLEGLGGSCKLLKMLAAEAPLQDLDWGRPALLSGQGGDHNMYLLIGLGWSVYLRLRSTCEL